MISSQSKAEDRDFRFRRVRTAAPLLLLLLVLTSPFPASAAGPTARQPLPESKFTFESLNIPPLSATFIAVGSSMLTVHFADNDHLLVTYGTRELIPRIPGDPREDDDRIVAGGLVELPTGKVLARGRWHLHDHGRYLWSLGQGRFLLREGEALSTLAPVANLRTPDPFFRTPLPYRPGVLDGIVVSADNRLLTIETHIPVKKKLTGIDINLLQHNGGPVPKPLLFLDFYRTSGAGTEDSPFRIKHAGVVRSAQPLRLPVDADGYLVAGGGKRGRWSVDFDNFGSKATSVGAVDSNCPPGLELVSPTQWLAFACKTPAAGSVTLEAYDFARHEIWEEPMGTLTSAPVFALAPAVGRFAMSRRLDTPAPPSPGIAGDQGGQTQEVRVYGTQTGDMLLKVNCSPAFRTAENFDLSPDGMRLAVVRNGAIEIYRLPELTKLDREDLAELQKLVPPVSEAPISLRRLAESADQNDPSAALASAEEAPESSPTMLGDVPPPPAATPASVAATVNTSAPIASPVSAKSEAPAESVRKPPTLLNPGEKPEFSPRKPKTPTTEPK